jgi:hypothetical protein
MANPRGNVPERHIRRPTYSLAALWVIHENVHVGQTLLTSSPYTIDRITFVVGL